MIKKYFVVMILMLLISPALSFGAESLSDRLSGKILLQVENNGEAWYLEPVTKERAFLGRPSDAFRVMRELGLGISENDYNQFQNKAPERLAGRILLRVEQNGEAYYVRPENLELIFLNRPSDAMRVMREQGLGISNDDLDIIVINEKYRIADKPKIELFVMSHCPFGTQIEKGLLPVLDVLGDSIDFDLKFNDYAMHGQKELDEQLSQYCVQKNNPEKLLNYLACFLADETQGEACLGETDIDMDEHSSCVSAVDTEYKITEMYNDRDTWRIGRFPIFPVFEDDNNVYSVMGSPTLVVDGVKVQSSRSPQALLATICSAFDEQPEECLAELSRTTPSAGFGFEGGGSSASAACGS